MPNTHFTLGVGNKYHEKFKSFFHFLENEKKHMEEQAIEQGGSVCDVSDPSCTHVVVDDHTVKSLPFVPEGRVYVVVQEVGVFCFVLRFL